MVEVYAGFFRGKKISIVKLVRRAHLFFFTPARPFHNFRASRLEDGQILSSSRRILNLQDCERVGRVWVLAPE